MLFLMEMSSAKFSFLFMVRSPVRRPSVLPLLYLTQASTCAIANHPLDARRPINPMASSPPPPLEEDDSSLDTSIDDNSVAVEPSVIVEVDDQSTQSTVSRANRSISTTSSASSGSVLHTLGKTLSMLCHCI